MRCSILNWNHLSCVSSVVFLVLVKIFLQFNGELYILFHLFTAAGIASDLSSAVCTALLPLWIMVQTLVLRQATEPNWKFYTIFLWVFFNSGNNTFINQKIHLYMWELVRKIVQIQIFTMRSQQLSYQYNTIIDPIFNIHKFLISCYINIVVYTFWHKFINIQRAAYVVKFLVVFFTTSFQKRFFIFTINIFAYSLPFILRLSRSG